MIKKSFVMLYYFWWKNWSVIQLRWKFGSTQIGETSKNWTFNSFNCWMEQTKLDKKSVNQCGQKQQFELLFDCKKVQ
jgi:hypothetical protein